MLLHTGLIIVFQHYDYMLKKVTREFPGTRVAIIPLSPPINTHIEPPFLKTFIEVRDITTNFTVSIIILLFKTYQKCFNILVKHVPLVNIFQKMII